MNRLSTRSFMVQVRFASAICLFLTCARSASAQESPSALPPLPPPATAPPAPPSPALTVDPSGAQAPAMTALVHLDTDDRRVTLMRQADPGGQPPRLAPDWAHRAAKWEPVCIAPCDLEVDPNVPYRMAGAGITPSSSFLLGPGPERLRVSAGSRSGRMAGIVFTGVGVLTLTSGALFLALSTVFDSSAYPGTSQERSDLKSVYRAVGFVEIGIGVVTLAIGIPLWLSNRTTVENESGAALRTASAPRAWTMTPRGLVF